MLTGTQLGVNAKDEIIGWLREMEILGLRNRECLQFQQAAHDLEASSKTYYAEVLVERQIMHLRRCMRDPIMTEYQGERIVSELMKLAAFEVLLKNLNRHRN